MFLFFFVDEACLIAGRKFDYFHHMKILVFYEVGILLECVFGNYGLHLHISQLLFKLIDFNTTTKHSWPLKHFWQQATDSPLPLYNQQTY